jgi:hypothetical protein
MLTDPSSSIDPEGGIVGHIIAHDAKDHGIVAI